jgi:hypothetical protein
MNNPQGVPGCRDSRIQAPSASNLDAGVVAVGDVEQPLRVEHKGVRQIEFARPLAFAAPGLDEGAAGIELQHARVALAVPLQYEDVAGRPDHRLVRFVEQPQMPERMPLAGVALDAQHHFESPGRIELVDEVRGHVGGPDVVLRVDPQTVRPFEQPVAEPADEIAVRIEFHQRHRSAMDDEDVAPGVEGNARRSTKVHARRQLERFGNRDVGKWWRCHLHNT